MTIVVGVTMFEKFVIAGMDVRMGEVMTGIVVASVRLRLVASPVVNLGMNRVAGVG